MKVEKLENGNIRLLADEGKIIQSKKTHYGEELQKAVPNVESTIVYLGKNDSEENYVEMEVKDGSSEV